MSPIPPPQPSPEPPRSAPDAAVPPAEPSATDEALKFAREVGGIVAALTALVRAEAALSLHAMRRAFAFSAVALSALAIALVCFSIALVLSLAHWMDSYPLALVVVGGVLVGGAYWSFRHAGEWRLRVGFS